MTSKIATIYDAGKRSREELRAFGRSLRERVPRDKLGGWKPASNRPDPVLLLQSQDKIRIPELVPLRYQRMVESPFKMFRGSAVIMAWDLAQTESTGVHVQACGDAHIHNFGTYASPERRVVFDINDFDETLPAPWEFDLCRLAASVVLDCRDNNFDDDFARDSVRMVANRYRDVTRNLADACSLDIYYAIVDEQTYFESDRSKKVTRQAVKEIAKSRRRTRHHVFEKWCTSNNGQLRFVEDPPLLVRLSEQEIEAFHVLFNRYRLTLQNDRQHALRQYSFRDAARRVVGVGSVGLGAYVVLLEGRADDDPLIIQIKEATESVLAPHVGKSEFDRHGERVVAGQRLMQATSDPFLGWAPIEDKNYYLRQVRDMKGKTKSASNKETYSADAEVCGGTLARAHARSVDPGLISGYLGESDKYSDSMIKFAFAYAEQAERDYDQLRNAISSGKVAQSD